MKKKIVFLILLCVFLNTVILPGSIEPPVSVPRLPSVQSSVYDALTVADLPARILDTIVKESNPLNAQLKAPSQKRTDTAGYTSLRLFAITAGKRMISAGEHAGLAPFELLQPGCFGVSADFRKSCQRCSARECGSIMLLLIAYLVFISRKSHLPWAVIAARLYGISPTLPLKGGFFNLLSQGEPQ
jgi:hypothetical protein